jgi:hypothetical protein
MTHGAIDAGANDMSAGPAFGAVSPHVPSPTIGVGTQKEACIHAKAEYSGAHGNQANDVKEKAG